MSGQEQQTPKRKRPASWNEYQRRYRQEHPEKVKQWQENFYRRRAEKLAALETGKGDQSHGRD